MKVMIQLLGQARQLAGAARLEIELPADACVHDAVPVILSCSDPRLASVLATGDGTLRRDVLAILREDAIDPAERGLIREGDELTLLPPMAGG